MIIACLHTAESNIAVFESAAKKLGFPQGVLRHMVRSDLLAAAEQAGGLTPDIAPFSRKDVNVRLSKAEYLDLMHQQW